MGLNTKRRKWKVVLEERIAFKLIKGYAIKANATLSHLDLCIQPYKFLANLFFFAE